METNKIKQTDLTYLKELSNGSNEFIVEMITVFVEQTPLEIANMEKHLAAGDWKSLRATAHKMKPSFSFMGIKELEGVIKTIEDYAANEKNLDLLPGLILKVKEVCTQAIEELVQEKPQFL
ncbi:MAG: Hpt domain-containing protein [Bacteroidia bacterium]|jgi:HPt (histidine-containing phosphotransfer) domain-containing protein